MRFDAWQTQREKAEVMPNGLKVLKEECKNGKPILTIWKPRAIKPFVNYHFQTIIHRDEYLARQIANFDAHLKCVAERKTTIPRDDRSSKIKARLRKIFGPGKYRVRIDKYSMGESIRVYTDKPVKDVEMYLKDYEHIDRDSYTGEILGGGNTYLSVASI